MKVTIVVPGRFWAFQLALQLQRQGYLHRLVTSYPVFEVVKYGIEKKFIRSIVSKELMQWGYRKISGKYPRSVFLNNWFDRLASYKIPTDSDIYIIWAGFGLHTIKKIRKVNPAAKCIIARGSAHIETQSELMRTIGEDQTDPAVIIKEKQEYIAADHIEVPGIFAQRSFLEKGIPPEKLFTNCFGVDLSLFSPPTEARPSVFTVGYTGTITSRKNIEGLIRVCASVAEKIDLRLIMAGPIDHRFDKSLLQQKFIDYKGVMKETDLPAIYRQMHVFVLNSIEDGFGMVLLQAMAAGVVPIATYNTGGPDIIKDGENGFLIPVRDDEALANKLLWLQSNPEAWALMSEKAIQSVKNGFSWDDYGNRAIDFYRKLYKSRS